MNMEDDASFHYKVLIPSAGLGNRLKGLTKNLNKALVSINNKPAISHIIEKFDESVEFVIPVGYKKELVIDFCRISYPNRKFEFVNIDLFEGEGSGLGHSILQCKDYLQCPFIFSSNDTIISEDIPLPDHNWMGYCENIDSFQYRSLSLNEDRVINILGKGTKDTNNIYIGLSGIKDYKDFWEEMENGKEIGSIEIGESFGLKALIEKDIKGIPFTWFDTGNLESLNETRSHFLSNSESRPIILEKEEEAIWFVGTKVIKFSTDEKFISNRVKRATKYKKYFPEIIDNKTNMYSYEFIDGDLMSRNMDYKTFRFFLKWISPLWKEIKLSDKKRVQFNEIALDFYKDKTYKRIKDYFEKFEFYDSEEKINGIDVPKIFDLLERIDWDFILPKNCTGFHGDLHFENILTSKKDDEYEFHLLDWRQDFGGSISFGDVYYDLAKLNHGLIISHQNIHNNLYSVEKSPKSTFYDFKMDYKNLMLQEYFYEWLVENGYNLKKVKLMTFLIFLNIASLHHSPYNQLFLVSEN